MRVIEYVNNPFEDSKNIAFDIETGGLDGMNNSEITMIGFEPDNNKTIFLINNSFFNDDNTEELLEELDINSKVLIFDTEKELLDIGLRKLLDKIDGKYHRLYAYNGKTWKGGFDIPFLRTRCIKNDIEWLFNDKYYFDIYPEIRDCINTSISDEGDESNDLDTVHNYLCEDNIEDPFKDSSEALTESVDKVVEHCYKDIIRTSDLFDIVMEYTSAREPSELKEAGYL